MKRGQARLVGVMLLVAWAALASCRQSRDGVPVSARWDDAPSFWVWNTKADDFDARAVATPLRWLAIEFPADSARQPSEWISCGDLHSRAEAIPVFRMPAGTVLLDDARYQQAVARTMREWFGEHPVGAIEIDYDCPTGRLADYADFLRRLRVSLSPDRLWVTALASWIDAPEFERLAAAADQLTPMFYDLEPDRADEVIRGKPRPLVDSKTLHWIRRWQSCPVSWRAGLPNFRRLTLFEADGSLVGHISRWDGSSLHRHPALRAIGGVRDGCTRFQVTADGRLGRASLTAGQWLVLRRPDQVALAGAIDAAKTAGADGVVWFAHPMSAPMAACSITHLATMQSGAPPEPRLDWLIDADGAVVLTNSGSGDVLPRDDGKPHMLVVAAERSWRFADPGPGSFDGVETNLGSLVHPEFLKEIHLLYHELPAGSSLRSRPHTVNPHGD